MNESWGLLLKYNSVLRYCLFKRSLFRVNSGEGENRHAKKT